MSTTLIELQQWMAVPSETVARLDRYRDQFKKLRAAGHPLRGALDKLQTLDLVGIIEGHA